MKKILEKILKFFTQAIINKYSPEIIGITGSVGKTTTKLAIFEVLSTTYNVGTNLKNYNNEIGIPLAVIGTETGGRSIFKWLAVFLKAFKLLIIKDKNYPNFLVLEFGADKPGDIKYLCGLISVKVAVVTSVAPVHIEFFENIDHIAKEKCDIVRALPKSGHAILNADDARVLKMGTQTQAEVVTTGFAKNLDYSASDFRLNQSDKIEGISFQVNTQDGSQEIEMPHVVGEHFVYSALAAIAVGQIYNIDLITIAKTLKDFKTPKGRMKVMPGIKKTTLIDDTYNSSSQAADEAIKLLAAIKFGNKKYAVLGDMLELGNNAEELHQQVGKTVVENKIDYLITAGELARDFARGAKKAGMDPDHIFSFKDSKEAGRFLQKRIKIGDVILIKGSQGARMEYVVKEVMAQPEKATDLLVRQDKSWKNC